MELYIDPNFLKTECDVSDDIQEFLRIKKNKDAPKNIITMLIKEIKKMIQERYILNGGDATYITASENEYDYIVNIFSLGNKFCQNSLDLNDIFPLIPLVYSQIREDERNKKYVDEYTLHYLEDTHFLVNELHLDGLKYISEHKYRKMQKEFVETDPFEWILASTLKKHSNCYRITMSKVFSYDLKKLEHIYNYSKNIMKYTKKYYNKRINFVPEENILDLPHDLTNIILQYLYDPQEICDFILDNIICKVITGITASTLNNISLCVDHYDKYCKYYSIIKVLDITRMLGGFNFIPNFYHNFRREHHMTIKDTLNEIIYASKNVITFVYKKRGYRLEILKKVLTGQDISSYFLDLCAGLNESSIQSLECVIKHVSGKTIISLYHQK